jgi:hypothetical protein
MANRGSEVQGITQTCISLLTAFSLAVSCQQFFANSPSLTAKQVVILSEPAEFAAPPLRGNRIQAASRRTCISFWVSR